MLADVVDLDSLKTGGRRAGTFFALNGMIAKVSAMIAVWAAAILVKLLWICTRNNKFRRCNASFKNLLLPRLCRIFLPALFLTWYYPLTKQKHKELRMELEVRTNKFYLKLGCLFSIKAVTPSILSSEPVSVFWVLASRS